MTVHRPAHLAVTALTIVLLAVRPPPLFAQNTSDGPVPAQQDQQAGATCRVQEVLVEGRGCVPLPQDEPQRVHGDDDGGLSTLGIVGLIVGVLIGVLVAKALTGNKNQSVKDLADEGPKAPEKELLGQYEVQGLIYPSWPLVLEVAADADATTFVQIVPAKGEKDAIPPLVLSDAGGAPWGGRAVIRPVAVERTERGMLAKFELPADLGRRGEGGFQSARLSVLSGRIEGDEFRYRPVDVLALGAGPGAVGSAALTITRFDPEPQRRRADYTVSWNAQRRFENVDAELVQRTRTARDVTRKVLSTQDICLTAQQRDLCVSGPAGPLPYAQRGAWPIEAARELERGQSYHMQLRAWTGRSASGGWIVGQAPRTLGW